jgi:hypothetical protein|tara:strand:- start:335 stop:598 length:264 start_codon:yes stop_codon:yes gene_type:complete
LLGKKLYGKQLSNKDLAVCTHIVYEQSITKGGHMPRKNEPRFCNVALLPEDHILLKKLADEEQRSMTRQLSVIIRKEVAKQGETVTV